MAVSLTPGLAAMLLRAKPVRLAFSLVFVVCFGVMLTTLVFQSFQQSPGQTAEAQTGRYEYALELPLSFPVGEKVSERADAALRELLISGADAVELSLDLFGVPVDGASLNVNLVEMNWAVDPFPKTISIIDGRLPEQPGEIAITTTLAEALGGGSEMTLAGGGIVLDIVGVVKNDFFRDDAFGYMAPGTWDSFPMLGDRYSISAQPKLYWSGGIDHAAISDVITRAFGAEEMPVDASYIERYVVDRAASDQAPSGLFGEVVILLLLAPFAITFVGGWSSAVFVSRIRATLWTVGVARTRGAASIAVVGSSLLAAVLGVASGVGIGIGIRPILDVFASSVIGPLYDIPFLYLSVVAAAAAGATLSLTLLRRTTGGGEHSIVQQRMRRYVPSLTQILPVFIILFVVVGTLLSSSSTMNLQITSTYAFGFAIVLIAPYALRLLVLVDPARVSPATVLGWRRLRGGFTHSAWTIISIAGLLMLAFSLAVLYSSSLSSVNEKSASLVSWNQAQFEPSDNQQDYSALRDEISGYTGTDAPMPFTYLGGMSMLGDGPVVVFETVDDMERALDLLLSEEQRENLEAGFVARGKAIEGGLESLRIQEQGSVVDLPVVHIKGVDESYRAYGGYMLRGAAEQHSLSTGERTTWLYTDLSDAQVELMRSAPEVQGFDDSWLRTYDPPPDRTEPPEIVMLGIAIGVVTGLVMAAFAASVSRRLRPNLAGMRALGLPRRWSAQVVVTQVVWVLSVSIAFGVIAALVATMIAIEQWMAGVTLHVPLGTIMATVAALCVVTAAAAGLSLRRLDVQERLGAR